MKRQWHIRRQFQASKDGARRWDHAYQLLLQWSSAHQATQCPALRPPLDPSPVEALDENRPLSPRLDPAPKPGVDD